MHVGIPYPLTQVSRSWSSCICCLFWLEIYSGCYIEPRGCQGQTPVNAMYSDKYMAMIGCLACFIQHNHCYRCLATFGMRHTLVHVLYHPVKTSVHIQVFPLSSSPCDCVCFILHRMLQHNLRTASPKIYFRCLATYLEKGNCS